MASDPKKIKVSVHNLKEGMYISELDRPWLDSPFMLQGFELENEQQIQQIQQICNFVYVDTKKSRVMVPSWQSEAEAEEVDLDAPVDINKPYAAKKILAGGGSILDLPPPPEPTVKFANEIEQAQEVHSQVDNVVTRIYDSIGRNKVPDFKQVENVVSEVVYSLNRNEYALEWMTQLKDKDRYESQHSTNVAIYAVKLGRHIGLEDDVLKTLGICGMMHDIGKLKVPNHILSKPNKLLSNEMEIMEKHCAIGVKILKQTPNVPEEVINTCQNHHERLDGSGYPKQLTGGQIDLLTQIVIIADVYDAITSENVYNPGYSASEAMSELYKYKDLKYDGDLVEAFIRCMGVYPVGTVVEMHSGEVGIVISNSDRFKLNPSVVMILNHKKRRFEKSHIVDTAELKDENGSFKLNIKRALNAGNYDVHPKDHFVN